jgi:hypothetical protein
MLYFLNFLNGFEIFSTNFTLGFEKNTQEEKKRFEDFLQSARLFKM